MKLIIARNREEMGKWVASQAAADLCRVIEQRGEARLLIATGSSQFEVLESLAKHHEVDWRKVTGYHLDEYIGVAPTHPASFCGYLKSRFVDQVPLKNFHYLRGDHDVANTIRLVGQSLTQPATPGPAIDVALVGIGENGHLAFNDPPADFEIDEPYIVVTLDQACRQQQVGEGWFPDLASVPTQAISMSIKQIMRAARIYCSVPDERKAVAVQQSLEGPVTPDVPASILQQHGECMLVIDEAAAIKLSNDMIGQATRLL